MFTIVLISIRYIVLAEGAHELVVAAMAYFEKKSEAKGLLLNQMGMAFLQNFTAGDGGHRPRQLLLSPGHLNFLDRFEDIMFTFAGDQVSACGRCFKGAAVVSKARSWQPFLPFHRASRARFAIACPRSLALVSRLLVS